MSVLFVVASAGSSRRVGIGARRLSSRVMATIPTTETRFRFIEIGANLTDASYSGTYFGRAEPVHAPDTATVLHRAAAAGVTRLMVTAGTIAQSQEALDLCAQYAGTCFSTVGVHPTRADEMIDTPDAMAQLRAMLRMADSSQAGPGLTAARETLGRHRTVVAVGECGLDYDRLQFCSKERQKRAFEMQFALAEESGLPMFFHNRNTGGDFVQMVKDNRSRFSQGVVHSYTGTAQEAADLIALDLYIGINGCSLKTAENLEVVKTIPLDRIMLETDCPYCEIRKSHAGHGFMRTTWPAKDKKKYDSNCLVKGRSEPCMIRQVCEVLAGVRGESEEQIARAAYNNTMRVFFPEEASIMGPSPYDVATAADLPP